MMSVIELPLEDLQHLAARRRIGQRAGVQLLQQEHHILGRRDADAVADGLGRVLLGVPRIQPVQETGVLQPFVGKERVHGSQPLVVRRGEPVEHEVRRGVVAQHDHQPHGVPERHGCARVEKLQQARIGFLVGRSQLDAHRRVHSPLVHEVEVRRHDRQLDHARGREPFVSPVPDHRAGAEVLRHDSQPSAVAFLKPLQLRQSIVLCGSLSEERRPCEHKAPQYVCAQHGGHTRMKILFFQRIQATRYVTSTKQIAKRSDAFSGLAIGKKMACIIQSFQVMTCPSAVVTVKR